MIVTRFFCDFMLFLTTFQILRTREDGVLIIFRPDGSKIVEYCDGTRITTHQESCAQDSIDQETGEIDRSKSRNRTLVTVKRIFR